MSEAKSKSKRKRHSTILEIEVIRKCGADDARVRGDAALTQSTRLAGRPRSNAKAIKAEKEAKRKAEEEKRTAEEVARKRADKIRREEKKAKDRERARAAAEAERRKRKAAANRIEEYLSWQPGSAASAVGPADESSARPSPYTIRERERRAAYEAWLLE